MLGVVIGDALGAGLEFHNGVNAISSRATTRYLNQILSHHLEYTDDTAMTICISESLIAQRKCNPFDIGQRFARLYQAERDRGFGATIVSIFQKYVNHSITSENWWEFPSSLFEVCRHIYY